LQVCGTAQQRAGEARGRTRTSHPPASVRESRNSESGQQEPRSAHLAGIVAASRPMGHGLMGLLSVVPSRTWAPKSLCAALRYASINPRSTLYVIAQRVTAVREESSKMPPSTNMCQIALLEPPVQCELQTRRNIRSKGCSRFSADSKSGSKSCWHKE
jgi:hypothetical protein